VEQHHRFAFAIVAVTDFQASKIYLFRYSFASEHLPGIWVLLDRPDRPKIALLCTIREPGFLAKSKPGFLVNNTIFSVSDRFSINL
jgi:hypothetical protein